MGEHMMAPRTVSPHAAERFVERWSPRASVMEAMRALMSMLYFVVHVEDIADERQSIWRLPFPGGPLIVVDEFGDVRTVLPEGARRPPTRR